MNNPRSLNDSQLLEILAASELATAVYTSADLVIEFVNDAMLTMWGKKDVTGLTVEQAIPETEGRQFTDLLKNVWNTGIDHQVASTPVNHIINGELKTSYFNFKYRAIKDSDGKPKCVLHTAEDVTGKVWAEYRERQTNKKLAERQATIAVNEIKLNQIISKLPVAITILIGPQFVIERANPSILAYWQKSKEEVFGKRLLDVLPELVGQPFPIQLKHVLETGESVFKEESTVKLEQPDGSIRITYVDYSYQPLNDSHGNRIGILVMSNDVTDKVEWRWRLEESQSALQAVNEEMASTNEELLSTVEELRQTQENLQDLLNKLTDSEQKLRSLVESAPFPIGAYIGKEMRIMLANQSIIDIWGKGNDVVGKLYTEILPELAGQKVFEQLNEVYDTGQPFHARNQRIEIEVNSETKVFYFNYSFTPLFDADGRVYGVMNTAADVTDLNVTKLKIEQSEQNFRNMIAQAPVAMCLLTGPNHVIELVNESMIEIWGKPYKNIINKPVFEALPDARQQGLEQIMAQVYNTGETYTANETPVSLVRYGSPDTVYQNFVYQPYYGGDGNILGILSISVDVTEQVLARKKIEQRERELRNIKKQLEAELEAGKLLQQQKDGFIGMASHELKTPLTSLTAIIQLLAVKLKNNPDTFVTTGLDKANLQVKRMSNMINGFLNVSRLESGKIQIIKQEFDLDELVKEVIKETELTVTNHIINLDSCGAVRVEADRDKISSVLSNLLSNAVKYSPKGKNIEVKCQLADTMARISIKDEGMGIKPEDQEKLFERYYRVETNHTRHISGFGIGLYLSAEIIQRHDGKIWIESESGVGSTFSFTLPRLTD